MGAADDKAVTKAWSDVAARHGVFHYSRDRSHFVFGGVFVFVLGLTQLTHLI
jgi:hypothetical protein